MDRLVATGLLLICCCIVLSGSQDVNKRSCCTAKQYEVRAGGKYLDKNGLVSFYMPRFAIDFDKQVASFEEMTAKYGNASYIIDYKGQKMYAFNRAARVCTKTDVKQPMEGPCMPKDASFTGQSTLGYGSSSLILDNYYMYRRSQGVTITAYLAMTSQGCVPVTESSTVQWQDGMVDMSIEYMDYQPGIKDPAVFQIPSYCENAEQADGQRSSPVAAFYALK